jgi:hypothetical protein
MSTDPKLQQAKDRMVDASQNIKEASGLTKEHIKENTGAGYTSGSYTGSGSGYTSGGAGYVGSGTGASTFGPGATGMSSGQSTTEAAKETGRGIVDSIKGTVAQVKEKLHDATRPSAEEQARAERANM